MYADKIKLEYEKQLFPVINPLTMEIEGYKLRKHVHVDGSWHVGLQANIIRNNNRGSFDILIQKRSGIVDRSPNYFDQSLAVQLQKKDKFDFKKALFRGMSEELGLKKDQIDDIEMLDDFNLAIIKKYEINQNFNNFERIFLYIIKLKNGVMPRINSSKLSSLSWNTWEDVKDTVQKNKEFFTKTASFYFSFPLISYEIERRSKIMLNIPSEKEIIKERLLKDYFIININDSLKVENHCLSMKNKTEFKNSFYEIIQNLY